MIENRISYNFLLFDLTLIFLFYVMGDTITTYYGLKLGHVELNTIPSMIFQHSEYGIYVILILKLFFFVIIYFVMKYLLKHSYTKEFHILGISIITMGVFLTLSNSVVLITGYNVFQLLGLM